MADVGLYKGNELSVLTGEGAWLSRMREGLYQKCQQELGVNNLLLLLIARSSEPFTDRGFDCASIV